MKKYTIAIQETIVDEFEIEAKDLREAFDIAAKNIIKVNLFFAQEKCILN